MTLSAFPEKSRAASLKNDAFEREVSRHRAAIFKAALRLTRNRDDAEDLAQNAIVRAGKAYADFDGAHFRAWVLRIMANLHINDQRSPKRRLTVALEDEVRDAVRDEGATVGVSRLLAEELDREIVEAIAGLPPIFARVVLMIDVAGVSYAECAGSEGVPVGTVRSRLYRGRALLRECLEDFALEEGYIRRG